MFSVGSTSCRRAYDRTSAGRAVRRTTTDTTRRRWRRLLAASPCRDGFVTGLPSSTTLPPTAPTTARQVTRPSPELNRNDVLAASFDPRNVTCARVKTKQGRLYCPRRPHNVGDGGRGAKVKGLFAAGKKRSFSTRPYLIRRRGGGPYGVFCTFIVSIYFVIFLG